MPLISVTYQGSMVDFEPRHPVRMPPVVRTSTDHDPVAGTAVVWAAIAAAPARPRHPNLFCSIKASEAYPTKSVMWSSHAIDLGLTLLGGG